MSRVLGSAMLERAMNPKELLLQTTRARPPHPLEVFLKADRPGEFHFYAQGLTQADFGTIFAAELRPLEVLVYKIPPDLLNPNYWEPLGKESENAVREQQGGIVTRVRDGRTLLWRSDRVAKGRLLRDGIDVPLELLFGYVFRTTGEGLAALARAWDGRDRLEWVGLRGRPTETNPEAAVTAIHADLAQMQISRPDEAFLYASQDDDLTRVVFSDEAHFHRAIEALLRGFAHNLTRAHVGHVNRRVTGQIARLAGGRGLSADPDRDFVDKGRTFEIRAALGRTPWGLGGPPAEALAGEDRLLFYYDRISGIWAISH